MDTLKLEIAVSNFKRAYGSIKVDVTIAQKWSAMRERGAYKGRERRRKEGKDGIKVYQFVHYFE